MRLPPRRRLRRLVAYLVLTICVTAPFYLMRVNWGQGTPLVWEWETGGEFIAGVAVDSENIYFAASDRLLRCMNWERRAIVWEAPLPATPFATPTVDEAAGLMYVTTEIGTLMVIDTATGQQVWGHRVETSLARSAPVFDDEHVYIGWRNGLVQAFDKRSGAVVWEIGVGTSILRTAALWDGLLLMGAEDGRLIALNTEDGSEVWTFRAEGPVRSEPLVHEGIVYFGSHDKNLYALDAATGEQIWAFHCFHEITTRPAIADGRIIFGSWDNHLVCLSLEDGTLLWRHFNRGVVETPPLIINDTVYSGSWDGGIYALRLSDGRERWRHQTGTWVTAAIALSPDGKAVLVACQDGVLRAFSVEPVSDESI